jgi:hypothetical protein
MTRFIAIGLTIIVLWVGWKIYDQWKSIKSEHPRTAATETINPRNLPGIPDTMKDALENSLDKAQRHGATGLREWLKIYRQCVEDPRLAWIELDYCVLVARENPVEARKIFHDINERTPPTSPLYPRLKQLEKTYE